MNMWAIEHELFDVCNMVEKRKKKTLLLLNVLLLYHHSDWVGFRFCGSVLLSCHVVLELRGGSAVIRKELVMLQFICIMLGKRFM